MFYQPFPFLVYPIPNTQATEKAKELIGGLADPKATGVIVEVLEVEGQSKVGSVLSRRHSLASRG